MNWKPQSKFVFCCCCFELGTHSNLLVLEFAFLVHLALANIRKCFYVLKETGRKKESSWKNVHWPVPWSYPVYTALLRSDTSPTLKHWRQQTDHSSLPCLGSFRHCMLHLRLGKDRCLLILQMCYLSNRTYIHVWKCLNKWLNFFPLYFWISQYPGFLSTASLYLSWSSSQY